MGNTDTLPKEATGAGFRLHVEEMARKAGMAQFRYERARNAAFSGKMPAARFLEIEGANEAAQAAYRNAATESGLDNETLYRIHLQSYCGGE
jgi:hypothetical protein